jgi:hypothetical protein
VTGRAEPPLGATVALIVVLALACFATAMPLLLIVNGPTPLPEPFEPQNQDAETQLYLLAFVVILPAALIAGRWLATAIAERDGAVALAPLAGLLAAALGGLAGLLKLSGAAGGPDGVRTVLLAAGAWWLLAAAVLLWRAPAAWLGRHAALAPLLTAAGAAALVLALTDLDSVSAAGIALGAIAAAAAFAAYGRVRAPRLGRGRAIAIEAAVVAALLLAVPDLVIFRPEEAPGNQAISLETAIIAFHQNLLLGPANQALGGAPLLVDTASQYGVGDIYALMGWFLLAPIGYGTFGLLDGIWTALWFGAGYAVLRLAGTSRTLSAGALAVAVVTLVFNLTYSVGALPQYGPLRFGMPMAMVLAFTWAARRPQDARAAHAAALAVAGVSALWSLEALAYTGAVYAALAVMRAWLDRSPLRRLAVDAAQLLLAWAVAHALFAAATLAATGQLPDWGHYLDYLDAFLAGPVGDLTYDVPRWSPGLALGAAYVASAAALVELARRRHPLLQRERAAIVALTGSTAYGIALLSYWVDRSLEHILVHVALPGLLMLALWTGVVLRSDAVRFATRRMVLAAALALAVLATAAAWSSIGDRLPRSALGHAAPGGRSLTGALDRLWGSPVMKRAAVKGERMLERHLPGEEQSLVLVAPDLAIEALLRSGRIDRLLLSDPWETSFIAEQNVPALRSRLAGLRPGDRMLVDEPARATLRALRAEPDADPLLVRGHGLAPLQQYALAYIDERFELRSVAREEGFEVLELRP